MDLLLSLIGAPVNALTFSIAIAIFVFQLIDRGLLKIGKSTSLGNKIDTLANYANHETTARLDKLIAMEEKEHEAQDAMRDTMRDVQAMLREFKEYGIKVRKD